MIKKSILMISPVDLSKSDGPKVHFSSLAKEFRNLGAKVRCILYTPLKPGAESIGDDIGIHFTPNPLSGNIFSRTFKYIFIVPIIIREVFRFEPEMVYLRFSPPAILYLLVLKGLKALSFNFKLAVEFNDWVSEQRAIQGENSLKVKLIEKTQTFSARLSDYIRVVTEGIMRRLLLHGVNKKKIAVIGNGTNIELFKPINRKEAKRAIGISPDYFYVGFIGNFAIWQGLYHLTQAIPLVLKVNNRVRFILTGDGPEMPKIRKAISQFKNDEVILTGRVPYKEAGKYINAFDIGVAPFIEERNASIGLSPLKIWDYAACGVPVITTRIRGLEIVEQKAFGILVPPGNPESLAEAILKLEREPEMRIKMGRRGRNVVEKQFSWNFVAKQILHLTFM